MGNTEGKTVTDTSECQRYVNKGLPEMLEALCLGPYSSPLTYWVTSHKACPLSGPPKDGGRRLASVVPTSAKILGSCQWLGDKFLLDSGGKGRPHLRRFS